MSRPLPESLIFIFETTKLWAIKKGYVYSCLQGETSIAGLVSHYGHSSIRPSIYYLPSELSFIALELLTRLGYQYSSNRRKYLKYIGLNLNSVSSFDLVRRRCPLEI